MEKDISSEDHSSEDHCLIVNHELVHYKFQPFELQFHKQLNFPYSGKYGKDHEVPDS